jgi:large subunit ribosomal protein L33
MAKKNKSVIVKLGSSSSDYFYTTYKNTKMTGGDSGKIKLKKYDPITKRHEVFFEKKIK